MWARNSAAAIALAVLCAAAPASAQSASGAAAADPWSIGWRAKPNGALPPDFWDNSSRDALNGLFGSIKPADLSPAARQVLARVVLSSGRAPYRGEAAIRHRLRLLEELGETDASIDLRRRYPAAAWGKAAAPMSAGLALAAGETDAACKALPSSQGDDPVWAPMRTACLVIGKNFEAAAAAAAAARTETGAADAWLTSVVAYMREPSTRPPEGRFGDMVDAGVSVTAGLPPARNAFLGAPPDVALAIIRNPSATAEQKQAALKAAAFGDLRGSDVRAVVEAAKASGRSRAAGPDLLALALDAAADKTQKPAVQATAYAAALKGVETAGDFRIAAIGLADAIKSLPQTAETRLHAETFTRAALVAGSRPQALAWRQQAALAKADRWTLARLDMMLGLGASTGDPAAHVDVLLSSVPAPAADAPAAAHRQADLRRIENTRLLFLQAGLGRKLTPAQRVALAGLRSAGRGVPDAQLQRARSAVEAGAKGEAALAIVTLLGSDASALSFADAADILSLLRRIGFTAEAQAVALEAMQPWKAF
jgi:hypothetical protein